MNQNNIFYNYFFLFGLSKRERKKKLSCKIVQVKKTHKKYIFLLLATLIDAKLAGYSLTTYCIIAGSKKQL